MKTKIYKTLTLALCTIAFTFETNAQLPNFTKVDTGAITQLWGGHISSTCFDMDNDGDLDLFVGNCGVGINRNFSFFKNERDGLFVEMPEFISEVKIVSSFGDIDNDGDADLFTGLPHNSLDVFTNDGIGNFLELTSLSSPHSKHYPTLIDLNNDGFLDVIGIDEWGGIIYNNGNGEFLGWLGLGLFQQQPDVFLHGVSWGDPDDDGDLDFFGGYTSSIGGPGGIPINLCYLNNGSGGFERFDPTSPIVEGECPTPCANWVDYDNDGDMDLYVHNIMCDNSLPALYENLGDMEFTRHDIINEMYRHSFANSSVWGDLDNDGDLDLFISVENNEFPWPPPDTSATPFNVLYLNEGNGQFTNILDHPLTLEDSHTALLLDHDNDGDLDVLMTRYSWSFDGYNNLYVNEGNDNSWMVLTCEGTVSNRSAIGTRVQAKCFVNGNHITQTREITPINGHLSYANLRVHFGMGDADVIDTLIIRWPSGIIDTYLNVKANRIYRAVEDDDLMFLCPSGDISFTTQEQIDNFPADNPDCVEIEANIEINGINITNLDGLSILKVINGNLKIHNNSSLNNLTGLNNLESIGGDFEVYTNNILQDFSGIENLTSISGDLKIYDNSSLTSLSGLDNIDPESIENLVIAANEDLSYCHVESICNFLYYGPNGSVSIQDNEPNSNCDDSTSVRKSCPPPVYVDELNFPNKINIWPNPFTTSITIEYELTQPSIFQITIYNHLGKQIETIEQYQSQGKQQIVWNADGLPSGVYYCVLKTEYGTQTMKMIKL